MSHRIIAISREYGSGGILIGRLVAEELGIPYYDRDLIDKAAHERGLDKEYIPQWQETTSSLTIWGAEDQALRMRTLFSPRAQLAYYSNEQKMFHIQSQIIHELAEAGPCVFVGRCAGYVLADHYDCLRIWVGADEDSRALRLYDEYLVRTGSLSEKIRIVDQGRAAYCKRCTGEAWGVPQKYQLCLDSGSFGVEGCAQIILAALEKRNKEGDWYSVD